MPADLGDLVRCPVTNRKGVVTQRNHLLSGPVTLTVMTQEGEQFILPRCMAHTLQKGKVHPGGRA